MKNEGVVLSFIGQIGFILCTYGAAFVCVSEVVSGTARAGTNDVILYSGAPDEDRATAARVGLFRRGDVIRIEVPHAEAAVNYADPQRPIITERVITEESGAKISCPWFMKLDGKGLGTRINSEHRSTINHKVFCGEGGCFDSFGAPIPSNDLLFGKYDLPKVRSDAGIDLGFLDNHWDSVPNPNCHVSKLCGPAVDSYPIYCEEFSIERLFSEHHYFEHHLVVPQGWLQELTDLDVDFRKIYLTFENSKFERANCTFSDLFVTGDSIVVNDIKDCQLPRGEEFTVYAHSRFLLRETRPCGKFVAKGILRDDRYIPDWFLGWYECDGRVDRSPIEKQFNYATRVTLRLTSAKLGE